MRADDTSDPRTPLIDPLKPPFAVSLDGIAASAPRQHYPDLLLINRSNRIAIELVLSLPTRRRLERILTGYRDEPDIAAVLDLAEDPIVFQAVQTAAADLGISDRVHVQSTRFPDRR